MADIEQFALENLNEHKKGLLGKTVSVTNMLAWTKVNTTSSVRAHDSNFIRDAAAS